MSQNMSFLKLPASGKKPRVFGPSYRRIRKPLVKSIRAINAKGQSRTTERSRLWRERGQNQSLAARAGPHESLGWLSSSDSVRTAALGLSPTAWRTSSSMRIAISGFSTRKLLTFSRPWPSLVSP